MDFDIYLNMQHSTQPAHKIMTLHEKNPKGTAEQLLNAVNALIPRVNVAITRTTVDEFGDAVSENVTLKADHVDVWFYNQDENMFFGQLIFSNTDDISGMVFVKGTEN